MNIIKKAMSVLLSILLVVLVAPFNNVYAAATATLFAVNCHLADVDAVTIYKLEGGVFTKTSGPDLPTGLEATWNDTQQRVILNVTQDVELKSILGGSQPETVIFCAEDLEIKSDNNSRLHLIVHPNSSITTDVKEYSFITCIKNIYINNMKASTLADKESAGLCFTLEQTDANPFSESNPYNSMEGIRARNFSIINSSVYVSTRNSAFYCTYDKNDPAYINGDSNNKNRLYVDNSKISYEATYHYSGPDSADKDPDPREMCFFIYEDRDKFEGDITIKNNSNIRIGYQDILPVEIVSGDSAICLAKESTINIASSIFSFQSSKPVSLASVGKVNITNCKKTGNSSPILFNCSFSGVPIFLTNSINITNSDFKFNTKEAVISRPFLEINTEGTGMGTGTPGGTTPTPSQPAIMEFNISEDDNLYDCKIEVDNSNNSMYAFSRMQTEPEATEVPVFTKINITLAGNKNAAVANATSETSYTTVINPSVSGTFNFETAANGAFNLTPLSQCKNFQILANPDPSPTPGGNTGGSGNTGSGSSDHSSHAVPNTSVTK